MVGFEQEELDVVLPAQLGAGLIALFLLFLLPIALFGLAFGSQPYETHGQAHLRVEEIQLQPPAGGRVDQPVRANVSLDLESYP